MKLFKKITNWLFFWEIEWTDFSDWFPSEQEIEKQLFSRGGDDGEKRNRSLR